MDYTCLMSRYYKEEQLAVLPDHVIVCFYFPLLSCDHNLKLPHHSFNTLFQHSSAVPRPWFINNSQDIPTGLWHQVIGWICELVPLEMENIQSTNQTSKSYFFRHAPNQFSLITQLYSSAFFCSLLTWCIGGYVYLQCTFGLLLTGNRCINIIQLCIFSKII